MKLIASAVVACALSGAASASVFGYNYAGPGQNNDAGTPNMIHSTFNDVTDQFTWTVTFNDGVAKDTDGFWLVVSPGPNPKGHAWEFAIMYLDASNILNPKATVYRYNGANAPDSYFNPGDFLGSSQVAGPSNITASALQSGGSRTMNISLDATFINNLYGPPAQPDWTGIQYGNKIGVWFHPVAGLNASYNSDGSLSNYAFARQGWVDFSNGNAPAPGTLALIAMSGLVARGRRR